MNYVKIIFLWVTIVITQNLYITNAESTSYEVKLTGCIDAVILQVKIDKSPHQFLLDTGSTFTAIDKSLENFLGEPLKIRQRITTPTDSTFYALYNPIDVMLGNFNIRTNHPYMLVELDFLKKVLGCKFDGVIAMTFIHQHIWDLDFDARKIRIIQNETHLKPENFETIIDIEPTPAGVPIIMIEIAGENIPFIIDTGDTGSGRLTKNLMDLMIDKKLVSDIASDTVASLSGVHSRRRVRVKQLKVGSLQYNGLLMDESLQNALGLGFLKRHRVVLDFPNKKLYLKKGIGAFTYDREDKSGLKLINDNEKLLIALVDERSPAASAGLQRGDVITAINNQRISGSDLSRIRELLRGDDGQDIIVTISRGEKTFESRFYLKKGFDHL